MKEKKYYVVVEETYPSGKLWVDCINCWWDMPPVNSVTHGRPGELTFSQAIELAEQLNGRTPYNQKLNCKHALGNQ